jgi:hypothetical protein
VPGHGRNRGNRHDHDHHSHHDDHHERDERDDKLCSPFEAPQRASRDAELR